MKKRWGLFAILVLLVLCLCTACEQEGENIYLPDLTLYSTRPAWPGSPQLKDDTEFYYEIRNGNTLTAKLVKNVEEGPGQSSLPPEIKTEKTVFLTAKQKRKLAPLIEKIDAKKAERRGDGVSGGAVLVNLNLNGKIYNSLLETPDMIKEREEAGERVPTIEVELSKLNGQFAKILPFLDDDQWGEYYQYMVEHSE